MLEDFLMKLPAAQLDGEKLGMLKRPVERRIQNYKLISAQEDIDRQASGKKPLFERVRPYSPPGLLERRGRPVPLAVRVIWFLLFGWWLGFVWVVISWSPFLLPYPLFDTVASLLSEVPSVMTLAWPATVPRLRHST